MLLTFDLFDTLAARTCGCAEALAEEVGRTASRAGLVATADAYCRGVARAQRALGPCPTGDWPLDVVHGAMTGVAAPAAKRLTALAVDVDVAMAQPVPSSIARLHVGLAAGDRVALVSDTNLAREHVVRVLARVGVDAAALGALFLSSEGHGRKADGSLFHAVHEALRPEAGAWLHLGDNAVSDGLQAELAGARAELVRDSPRADERLVARLAAEVRGKTRGGVVIWGAGQRGWALLRACRLAGVPVEAFWDREGRFHGHRIDGVPIAEPWSGTAAHAILLAVPRPPTVDPRLQEILAWEAPHD